jgi:hypothetical protein
VKEVIDTVETSVAIQGTAIGWSLPRSDIYGFQNEIYQQTVRSHTVQ